MGTPALRGGGPEVAKVLVLEAAVQDAAKEPKSPVKRPKLDTALEAPKSEAAETVVAVEVVEAVEAVEAVEVAEAVVAEAVVEEAVVAPDAVEPTDAA